MGRLARMDRRTPGELAHDAAGVTSAAACPLPLTFVALRSGVMAGSSSVPGRVILTQAIAAAGRERDILAQALADLDQLGWDGEAARTRWLEALADLGRERHAARHELASVSDALGLPRSAEKRLLAYLRLHVGTAVESDALAGVAGISAWQRRIRELRVEQGWRVRQLGGSQYQLDADVPDVESAAVWATAAHFRNLKGPTGRTVSARERLLGYFQANIGRPLTKEQLHYVSGSVHEHGRRIRELVELGWQIESSSLGAGLGPGDYVMVSGDRLPQKARRYIKQRAELLDKAEYTCSGCGGQAPAVRLQVHHVVPVHLGGTNDDDNLVVLCIHCHAGRHAVDRDSVADELLDPGAETRYGL